MGIVHRIACPYMYEQHGTLETKICRIVGISLTLLAHLNLPLHCWNYAFHMSVLFINSLPSPIVQNKNPLVCLYGHE